MDLLLEFADSEVGSTIVDGGRLCLRFSAACTLLGPERGFSRGVELIFDALARPLDSGGCVGRLRAGRLTFAGGPWVNVVALPSAPMGPVEAELSFANGSSLAFTAGALTCGFRGEANFVESYAC